MAKRDLTTFYLDSIDLPVFLGPHEFYVSEAIRRLIEQFNDIDCEAQAVEDKYLELFSQSFDPEHDNEGAVYDRAFHEGIAYQQALIEMKNTVILAMTASMFHKFDKTLREKTIKEFRHWQDGEVIEPMIWNLKFHQLIELLEWVSININGTNFSQKINACRLVVNVYKHGNGDAHKELLSKYPEYYYSRSHAKSDFAPRHDDLVVSQEQFIEFAGAITTFWKNIPQYCFYSQLGTKPAWFDSEYKQVKKKIAKQKSGNH